MTNRLALAALTLFASAGALAADTAIAPAAHDPVLDAHQVAEAEWNANYAVFLSRQDDPVLRSFGLDTIARYETDERARESRVELRAITNSPEADAETIWLASSLCGLRCLEPATLDRLAVLDPGNAAVPLLGIKYAVLTDPGASADTAANRERLIQAATSGHLDSHYGAGWENLARSMATYLVNHPYPVAPGSSTPQSEGAVLWYGMLAHVSGSIQMPTMGRTAATGLCLDLARAGESDMISHCQALADLMINASGTLVTAYHGRWLKAELAEVLDGPRDVPKGVEQRWSSSWATTCAVPAWTQDPRNAADLSADAVIEWSADLRLVGETEAFRRAAIRDHGLHPERYVIDPSECSRLENLDDATVAAILDGEDRYVPWHEALARLEDLDPPAGSPGD